MRRSVCCLIAVALAVSGASAQQPANCPPVAPLYPNCPPVWRAKPGGSPLTPTPMGIDPLAPQNPNALDTSLRDGSFSRSGEAGGQSSATAAPGFDGDFGGITYTRLVTDTVIQQQQIGTQQVVTLSPTGQKVVTNVPIYKSVGVPVTREVREPVLSRYSGIKITDNDGPRPVDRIAFGYNYYDRVNSSLNSGLGPVTLQRQSIGFEKTFFDGEFSFGMRLPFGEISGPSSLGSSGLGDMSLLYKWAFYDDRRTGDVISTCLIITTPTGNDPPNFADGTTPPRSWIIQTAACFLKNFSWGYVQGATSILAPTDTRDPTIFGNSLSAGYWLYRDRRDRIITSIVPVVEVHVTTPLTQRDPTGNVYLQDQVNVTSGIHFMTNWGTISPAIGVPTVGPNPWRVEFVLNMNLRF